MPLVSNMPLCPSTCCAFLKPVLNCSVRVALFRDKTRQEVKAGKKAGRFGFGKTHLVTRCVCLHIPFLHNLHFCSATLLIFCKANKFNARFAFPRWPEWESTSHLTQVRTWCADHLFFFFFPPARVHTYPARELRLCPAAWLPKATTLLPVPRYQPVESRLWVLWRKGGERWS